MFNSSILDVIIGLVFCFASVALFVSSINEALASFLKLRHKTLLAGMQKLLNDPDGTGLVKSLYAHALIDPMSLALPPAAATADGALLAGPAPAPAPRPPAQVEVKPAWPVWASGRQLPAYIASRDFAHALIDIIRTAPAANAGLKTDIDAVADPQLRQALQGFYARAAGDVDKFSDAVANWFDNAMDRLSGTYKRKSQFWTFLIALFTAAALNIDAFHVLDQLWRRPELSAAIVSPASTQLIAAAVATSGSAAASAPAALSPTELMTTLNTLPVGWAAHRTAPADPMAAFMFYLWWALGVAITASAAVFGAPFWFDLLQQLIQIRGTGAKPAPNRDRRQSDAAPAA
jgi:hypothetical protein